MKSKVELFAQCINILIFLAIGLTYYLGDGNAFYVPVLVLFGFSNSAWPLFLKGPKD